MTNSKSQRGGIAFNLLIAIFLVGVASLGFAVSSADVQPDFALFTVSFLFLLGISQVGVVFTAILRIVHADWGKPWYRLAEISTLAFFPFAIVGFALIVYFARDDLFYWLHASPEEHISPWLNLNWLVIRNLSGLLLFYGLAFFYTRKSLRADSASGDVVPAVDHDEVEKQLYKLSPIVILAFVLCNTFIAWDFAMMLIPHWHSSVVPIHYWYGPKCAPPSTRRMTAAIAIMAAQPANRLPNQ